MDKMHKFHSMGYYHSCNLSFCQSNTANLTGYSSQCEKRVEHIHSTLPKQPIYLREKRSLAGRAKMSAILACIVGGAAARPQFGPSYELPPAYCPAYPATRALSQTNSNQHQQEQLRSAEPGRVGFAVALASYGIYQYYRVGMAVSAKAFSLALKLRTKRRGWTESQAGGYAVQLLIRERVRIAFKGNLHSILV